MGTFTGQLRINQDLPKDLQKGYLIPGAKHDIGMRISASIASRDTWVKFQYGPDNQETTLIMSCPHTRFYSDPWHPLFLFWVLGKGGVSRFLQVMFNPSFWLKGLAPSMTLKKECDTHTYATSLADTRFGSCQSYGFGPERLASSIPTATTTPTKQSAQTTHFRMSHHVLLAMHGQARPFFICHLLVCLHFQVVQVLSDPRKAQVEPTHQGPIPGLARDS